MKITRHSTDQAILSEVGERLARTRLDRNLTQAELAADAGVSKRTVERMESGESVQFTSFVRVVRALGLAERLDSLLTEPALSPMARLESKGRQRRRASSKSGRADESGGTWSWGE
jgi:transcriptional regulator with XRE-family HTH domain